MEHELEMLKDEQGVKLAGKREFAKDFMQMILEKLEPSMVKQKIKRSMQDKQDLADRLRAEEAESILGGNVDGN